MLPRQQSDQGLREDLPWSPPARPSMDFDGRYGAATGSWTTEMFIEAVYQSLQEKK